MSTGENTAAIALMEIAKGAEEAFNGVKGHTDDLN